jgi:hypothetical protein
VRAYQLKPLRKSLLLIGENLFIADEVGLGNTIEAGSIIRQLLMCRDVRRIVASASAVVVPQGRDELAS